jgi:hypothetical protein
MRIGCKGHVKVKLGPKEGCWFFDAIDLKHNHQLHLEKWMTCFKHSHKGMEDRVKTLMEVMTQAEVQHQAQMNMMSELYGRWISAHSWSGTWEIGLISHTLETLLQSWSSIILHLNYVIYIIVHSMCAGKQNLCVRRDQMTSQSW